MTFHRIDYLEWARAHLGRCRFDLARSNIKALTHGDLDLSLDDVDLSGGPDAGGELRDLLAKRHGVPATGILLTSGATMGIFLALAAVLSQDDAVLLESPHYEPLLRICRLRGADVAMLDRRFDRGWQIELEELERHASRGLKAVVLTNTHNPSGAATSPEKLQTIGQIARDCGATVVCDEAYLDGALVPGLRPASALGPNLISVSSLTKIYGLGALRLGWIAGPEPLIQKARLALDYLEGPLPGPSESIALKALRKAPDLVRRCREITERNLKIVDEWMEKHDDLRWVRPDGGTVCLIKLPQGMDAQALSSALREKHSTLVVPGDFFGARNFVRVSLGTDEDVLRQGLKNLGKTVDQTRDRESRL